MAEHKCVTTFTAPQKYSNLKQNNWLKNWCISFVNLWSTGLHNTGYFESEPQHIERVLLSGASAS